MRRCAIALATIASTKESQPIVRERLRTGHGSSRYGSPQDSQRTSSLRPAEPP